ncbi:ATP-binding protein [Natronococcus jeotgali]|uniref:ATP-binding protein n=1 Tax=Natronococcus jeotgali TaxID=413812 RepID=UPI0009FCD6BA|nr:AAA family ATPase [Natronococcus jeotgali]
MEYATVARTISVEGHDYLLIEWGQGGIDILLHPNDLSPETGDAILVDSREVVEVIDPIGVDRGNSIGIVRKELDERAVVEQGGRLAVYVVADDVSVESGNTVEISSTGIIRDVVKKTAIKHESRHPASTDIEDYIHNLKFSSDELDIGFEDFGGMSEQLKHVQKRVELLLTQRGELEQIGTQPKLGALFHGEPGTGKTHFAKILASESDADFYRIRGPEIVTKWIGDTEEILRELFNHARRNEPAILFFDEIDSLGSERGDGPNQQFGNRIVAQLLSLMDGVDQQSEGLLVIGSTNRIEGIDEALLRPGRLDWKVEFEIPGFQDRVEIFESLRDQGYDVNDTVDTEEIASLTDGWTGAQLRSLLDEAGVVSVAAGRNQITMTDLKISYERRSAQS